MKLGRRPHGVRPAPRLSGRAAQAPPVPGPRPHGRAHHRRLHRRSATLGPHRDPAAADATRRSTRHAQTYVEQASAILDSRRTTEVRRNSEWLGGMGIADVLRLEPVTVARMLERNDFSKRYASG